MIHAYITGVAPAAPPPAYYLAPLTGLAAVEIWGWRGSVGTAGKAGILGILGKCGILWPTGDALCPQTHNTCLNNSFVGRGRHWWRPYMVAKMIVLLLWRECVLSRLFVYFRSAIVDYCTANGSGDW